MGIGQGGLCFEQFTLISVFLCAPVKRGNSGNFSLFYVLNFNEIMLTLVYLLVKHFDKCNRCVADLFSGVFWEFRWENSDRHQIWARVNIQFCSLRISRTVVVILFISVSNLSLFVSTTEITTDFLVLLILTLFCHFHTLHFASKTNNSCSFSSLTYLVGQ